MTPIDSPTGELITVDDFNYCVGRAGNGTTWGKGGRTDHRDTRRSPIPAADVRTPTQQSHVTGVTTPSMGVDASDVGVPPRNKTIQARDTLV